ncbi:MAG TPA: hypothetical protein V6C52_09890 [Coleofasciculaceae cyanobacterium]
MNPTQGRVFAAPMGLQKAAPQHARHLQAPKTTGLTFGQTQEDPESSGKVMEKARHPEKQEDPVSNAAPRASWISRTQQKATQILERMREMEQSKADKHRLHWTKNMAVIDNKKEPLEVRNEAVDALVPAIATLDRKMVLAKGLLPVRRGYSLQLLKKPDLDELVRHVDKPIRLQFLKSLADLETDFFGQNIAVFGKATILAPYINVFADTQTKEERENLSRDLQVRPYRDAELRRMVLDIIESLDAGPLPPSFKHTTPDLYKNFPYPRYQFAKAFENDLVDSIREKAHEIMENSEQPPAKAETKWDQLTAEWEKLKRKFKKD